MRAGKCLRRMLVRFLILITRTLEYQNFYFLTESQLIIIKKIFSERIDELIDAKREECLEKFQDIFLSMKHVMDNHKFLHYHFYTSLIRQSKKNLSVASVTLLGKSVRQGDILPPSY